MIKSFKVMNRNACEKYCKRAHNESSIIISIKDPWDCDADIYQSDINNVKDILRLDFVDLEAEKSSEYCMQDSDGKKVVKFVQKWLNKDIDMLIIHCNAGVSRSPGVMKGILKALLNDDSLITKNRNKKPNKTCFEVTYKAFMDN